MHIFHYISVSSGQNYSRYREHGRKRHMLSFRPLHFAAVDLPLGNKESRQDESSSKAGAFKINDGGVVGMSRHDVNVNIM